MATKVVGLTSLQGLISKLLRAEFRAYLVSLPVRSYDRLSLTHQKN